MNDVNVIIFAAVIAMLSSAITTVLNNILTARRERSLQDRSLAEAARIREEARAEAAKLREEARVEAARMREESSREAIRSLLAKDVDEFYKVQTQSIVSIQKHMMLSKLEMLEVMVDQGLVDPEIISASTLIEALIAEVPQLPVGELEEKSEDNSDNSVPVDDRANSPAEW